jgi:uncharacterized delta-60 repeat protein
VIAWLSGFLLLAATGANATEAGDLDTSFGGDGVVTTSFGDDSTAFAVALQRDGKIVVVGETDANGLPSFALARYRRNGTLDTSFGATGQVTTDFGGSFAVIYGLTVQPDGKIVVAGTAYDSVALARYLPNGTLDMGFGTAGVTLTSIAYEAQARDLALQPDGKIVVVGDANINPAPPENRDFVLARYHADGTLDTSFGGTGVITSDFSDSDGAAAVALQRDGKIVVAGSLGVPFQQSEVTQFAVARYLPDGTLDMKFGKSGHVTTDFGDDDGSGASAVVIQPNGKIIAAGYATIPPAVIGYDFALVRYHRNGSLDRSFGDAGLMSTDFGNDFEGVNDIALQPDGKIVAAGGGFEFSLARYSRKGTLDAAFGNDGKVTVSFEPGRLAIATSLAIQPFDGRLVLAGWSPGDFDNDFTIARFHAR